MQEGPLKQRFPQKLTLCGKYSHLDAFMNTTILTSSIQGSNVIDHPYLYDFLMRMANIFPALLKFKYNHKETTRLHIHTHMHKHYV